jgi:hypothetical protein
VDLALAKEIENEDKATEARKIIVDIIDAEKLKKRENKSANKLLDTCAKANSALQEACMALTPEAKIEGVEAQLQAIEKNILTIRAFLLKK